MDLQVDEPVDQRLDNGQVAVVRFLVVPLYLSICLCTVKARWLPHLNIEGTNSICFNQYNAQAYRYLPYSRHLPVASGDGEPTALDRRI